MNVDFKMGKYVNVEDTDLKETDRGNVRRGVVCCGEPQ